MTAGFAAAPATLAAHAQEIAASFDLRALPDDFYANPYPVYDMLRQQGPIGIAIKNGVSGA